MVQLLPSDDPVVEIRLSTDARGNATYDWAAWSEFEFDLEGSEAASSDLELIGEFDGTFIYENPNAVPRAFVVHDAEVVADVEAAEAVFDAAGDRFSNGALRLEGFDITEQAVVEADPEDIPGALTDSPNQACADDAGKVEITRYEAREVTLRVETACTGLVVLSDTYFPGWQATVNDEPADIHPTNMALRGVVVEAGASEVVFRYQPGNFRVGIFVAFGAVVTVVAVGLIPTIRRRTRTESQLRT
jgi:hypothetical protein